MGFPRPRRPRVWIEWALLLVFAAAVSFATGEVVDAWIVVTIVAVSAAIGYRREQGAAAAAAALETRTRTIVRALRDGAEVSIPVEDLVPGDVIALAAGSLVRRAALPVPRRSAAVPDRVVRGVAPDRAGHRAGGPHPTAVLPKPTGPSPPCIDGRPDCRGAGDPVPAAGRPPRPGAAAGDAPGVLAAITCLYVLAAAWLKRRFYAGESSSSSTPASSSTFTGLVR